MFINLYSLINISTILCSKNNYPIDIDLPGYTSCTVTEQVCFLQNITDFSLKINDNDYVDFNYPTDVYLRYEPEIIINMTCQDKTNGQMSFLGDKKSFRVTPVNNLESDGVCEIKSCEDIIITYTMNEHTIISFETKLSTVYTRIDENVSEISILK